MVKIPHTTIAHCFVELALARTAGGRTHTIYWNLQPRGVDRSAQRAYKVRKAVKIASMPF